jgi:hypothetical protein
MIISLHTPKAAGSSFKKLLEKEFSHSLISDYKDKPFNKNVERRIEDVKFKRRKLKYFYKLYYKCIGIECIHGHFLPYGYDIYLNNPDTKFITWLRDPLQRLASNYFYWFRAYNKNKSGDLHKKVVGENWSFEKFAFSEEMKNFYNQFLYKFPIENFDFIGLTEFFEDDLKYFSEKYLNKKITHVPITNININKTREYYDDPILIKELKEFHSVDYSIYNFAIQKRNSRFK